MITDAFKTVKHILRQALNNKLAKKSFDDFLRLEVIAGCKISYYLEGCEGFTYKFKLDNNV